MRAWSAIARNEMSNSSFCAVARAVAELAGHALDALDDGLEQIDVVIAEQLAGFEALNRRRNALQPAAGIDMLHRQRRQLARRVAVVLDEDQVAELDEALASLDVDRALQRPDATRLCTRPRRDRSGSPSTDRMARYRPSPRNFPSRNAGYGPASRSGIFFQYCFGLVVIGIDRRPQPLGRNLPDLGDQLPMPRDGRLFVVIPERPVTQHLEEGVMVGVAADRFEVVMLARNPQAFLAIGHPLRSGRPDAEEVVLEWDHAGVGEEQRRVALGNNRGRGHDLDGPAL